MTTAPRRRGPAPRYSREQLVDAAVTVVEAEGFGALSLRSVARELDVGPMTLYTYVSGSEELAALVVNRLIEGAVRGLRLPRDWRSVLRVLARRLDELVTAHPAMVDAYGRGMVHGGASATVAKDVVGRLIDGGLSEERAVEAYLGVHAIVLGGAVIRAGVPGLPLSGLVDTFIDGVAVR